MTVRLALSCFVVFAAVHVVFTQMAFRLVAGFNPRLSLVSPIYPASLYILLLLGCVALASRITVRARGLVLGATLASAVWVLSPFLVDLIAPKGSSFSISLGGVPVIVEGERTDFGMRLSYAQVLVRIASSATILTYLSLIQRKA